jgi:hypothetical protein
MLFPGCRIRVVESSAKGSTGPIPGSVGFVSNFSGQGSYVDFQRVVWYRYGKKGKERIETGRFAAIFDDSLEYQIFGKRRVGRIEVCGSKGWESMSTMEFLCWAFSILRLPKSVELQKQMASDLRHQFGIKIQYTKHAFKPAHLFHGGTDFENFASRYTMFKYCRSAREKYYRNMVNTIKQAMQQLHKHVQQDVERERIKRKIKHDPKSFAEAVVNQKMHGPNYRYKIFVGRFSHDAILAPRALQICKDNAWVVEIVKKFMEKGG